MRCQNTSSLRKAGLHFLHVALSKIIIYTALAFQAFRLGCFPSACRVFLTLLFRHECYALRFQVLREETPARPWKRSA